MENENQKTNNEESSKKKKFSLIIDYSKFQNNFMNSIKKEESLLKNNNKEKDKEKENDNKLTKNNQKSKNYDQFLNVSDILNENLSQSSLTEKENSKIKNENIVNNINNINNNNNTNSKKKSSKINRNIFNNNFDNFSIGESDEQNILLNYNDLLLSYNDNNLRAKFEQNNDKKLNDVFTKTTLNSYRKKKNYTKFINKNNLQLELSKTIDINKINNKLNKSNEKNKEKTSYAKINAKNKLLKEKTYRNKNITNKASPFNLSNEINNNYNNSVLTISDISNVPSTTTTVDFITGSNSKNFSSKKKYNNNKPIKVNKINSIPNFHYSNIIMNKNNKNKKRYKSNTINNTYNNSSKYHSVTELKYVNKTNNPNNMNNSNNNNDSYNNNYINTKIRKKSYETKNNLMLFVNKKKPNENKKDDLIYLLDDIKAKYKNQENKFINQQKNMKSEIEILREKLKTLSVNEALYQVEIEKLKRKNINNNELNNNNINNNINNINNNLNLIKSANPSEKRFFEKKLDDIIKKHNIDNNNNTNNNINNTNINLYSFSKKTSNKFEQLLDFFNLDKNLFTNDNNTFLENDEFFNYEKAFNEYPQIKQFIEILVDKYKKEKEYRTRLEEKTVEIFTNDMKTINILEKKIKKYEENYKQYKNNSCLNISLDAGLSDNITKNSYRSSKSCDKII